MTEHPTAELPPLPAESRPTAELPPPPADPSPPAELPPAPQVFLLPPRRRGIAALVALVLFGAALFAGVKAVSWVGGLDNPLAGRTTDRSQPVVLKSIQDLARFEAATGTFQVVVDLERDVRYVPSVLYGERTLFVAVGTVDAYVDFAGLDSAALEVSEDRTTVELALPEPALEKPNLDVEQSYVFAEKRGVLNRFQSLFGDDPNRLRDLYVLADDKLAEAAARTELAERAETNTRAMLTGLMKSLGFTTVTVRFTGS
jgi:hypothetical protein